jgi:hypothetical protein
MSSEGPYVLLGIRRFILDVEPLLVPALDGVDKFYIKIAGFRTYTNINATYIVNGVIRVVAVEVKNTFP